MDAFHHRITEITRKIINNYTELFAASMAEHGHSIEDQRKHLDQLGHVILSPIFEDTIFENGRRIPLRIIDAHLQINRELLARVSDDDILEAFATPISKILRLSQLNVAMLLQTQERFRKTMLAGIRRSHKNIVPITTITSFVQCRIDTFCSRIKKIVSRLIKKNIPLSPPQIILKTLSWPEWDQIEDKKFVASIQGWLEKTLKNTKYEALIPIVSGLCWDTLTLTKQSSLKNVGQKLRTIAIPESQAILNAFATSIFKNDIDLCLRKWTTFSELILSFESVIQRERQLFGAAWDSEIFLLKVTDPSESLFGFSEPRELPWELPLVCWSTREIKALRDFLTGIAKSLASHGLVPFRDLRSESNQTLKLSASLPPVGIRLQAPSANTPSYDHQLTSTALNATRNLILSKFFALDLVMKSEVVKQMRTHLELQYPRAKSIWERRLHNLSSKNIETQFVNLVDAFQPLMGLPVLYDPFRSPDLNQLSMPGPVFVIGVHNIPFECTFGIPLPSIIATGKNGALRIRIVRVSSTQECTWWGDRSVHISKISQQKTEDVLASILGDGLNFVISA